MQALTSEQLNQKIKKIKAVIFDVDGVLTNGQLFYSDQGESMKAFNVKDGFGMKLLMDSGIKVAIITAKRSKMVEQRMQTLNIKHLYQGVQDKTQAFDALCDQLKLKAEAFAYVGDDLLDLPVMNRVGVPVAVANAHPLVKTQALITLQANGGEGAARECCELILEAQNLLAGIYQKYNA